VSRPTREYLAALFGLAVGGLLCVVAVGLGWGEATAVARAVPPVPVTGADVLPVAQATGLLALAAVVAVHATRRWGRRLVGAVLAVAGLGTAAAAAVTAAELADRVVRQAGGGYDAATAQPAGPLLVVAGALLVAGAGVAVAVRGPDWPGLGARYERSAANGPRTAEQRERAAWDALDRGEDPTV
jgi:uncharacterized membrane protein (TIGR02234 family)